MTQRIWVIGAGQLGQMMKHAGMPLQLDIIPVNVDHTSKIDLQTDDIVTAEREAWPINQVTSQLSQHPNFINAKVFSRLADRLTQKTLLDQLNVATAPWCRIQNNTTAETLHQQLGESVLLKTRSGGYDGRGQLWLHKKDNQVIPQDWLNSSIAEQLIDFDDEVSLIGVRDHHGKCYFYPLTLNLHVKGILMASISPVPHLVTEKIAALQKQAEIMLSKILHELNYVGVMAMECFRLDGKLIINELAPRVHNSGHWTQAGASYSQFEAHLRAIANLPLSTPTLRAPSLMINLVGMDRNNEWLAISGTQLYWYGKKVHPGRKVGHINFCGTDTQQRLSSLNQLMPLMPGEYEQVLQWIIHHLASRQTN